MNEQTATHTSIYDSSHMVVGTDGNLYPQAIYADKLGEAHEVMSTAFKAERERLYRQQKADIENYRQVLGTDKYKRSEPVTMRGKARKAAGFSDWVEVDMRAEAEEKGVSIEQLEDYAENPKTALGQTVKDAVSKAPSMSFEQQRTIYEALVAAGFNPDADTRL